MRCQIFCPLSISNSAVSSNYLFRGKSHSCTPADPKGDSSGLGFDMLLESTHGKYLLAIRNSAIPLVNWRWLLLLLSSVFAVFLSMIGWCCYVYTFWDPHNGLLWICHSVSVQLHNRRYLWSEAYHSTPDSDLAGRHTKQFAKWCPFKENGEQVYKVLLHGRHPFLVTLRNMWRLTIFCKGPAIFSSQARHLLIHGWMVENEPVVSSMDRPMEYSGRQGLTLNVVLQRLRLSMKLWKIKPAIFLITLNFASELGVDSRLT